MALARARRRLALLGALLLLLQPLAQAQLSKAVAFDSSVDASGSKFLQRTATADARIGTGMA